MGYVLKYNIRILQISLSTLVLFCTIGFAQAQIPTYYLNQDKSLSQYNVESWTIEDGLPTSSLLGLCQTDDGYLWVSSYDGLIRFDGHSFKIFNKSNVSVFESNTIRKLVQGKNGTLWMTTQGNGLVSHKNGRFIRYGEELGLNHLYRALYIDDDNRIWSASPDKGWFYFEKGQFNFLSSSETLNNIEVRAIDQSDDGAIWFGTFGAGLYRYADGEFTSYTMKDGLPNDWVYSLFYDSKGRLWVGTSSGACYFDGKKFVSQTAVGSATVNDILEDKYGNIWMATNRGLYRMKSDSDNTERLYSGNGLTHNFINDFLIDNEGSVWMAFYKGGLAQLKDGKFTNYTKDGGLGGKVVNALCNIDDNKVLTAFDNGRFSIIENETVTDYRFKTSLKGERIRHLLRDSKGNLWISTYKGLLKVDPNGREIWLSENTGFPHAKTRLTFEDSRGNIWVGTRNNGLVRINADNSYTLIDASNGLSANLIMSIDEDKEGNILVGTSEGESGFNSISQNDQITQYSTKDGFVSNVVFNSYCDKAGNIWVASLGGLSLISDGKVSSFTTQHGLTCDSPFDVIEDDFGFLWLPCSKGIMRVAKSELLDVVKGNIQSVSSRLFDKNDGMTDSECNATAQSLKKENGNLMFPTIDGIAQIDPSKILTNNFLPPVYIEKFVVDGQSMDLLSSLTFDPGIIRVNIDYTAVSLYEPEEIRFKYKLEGFDSEWVNAGAGRSISYTNLKHGTYVFRVKASNNDGIWNESEAELKFVIKPRFVDTAGFYLLLLLCFIVAVMLGYRLRTRHLKLKQEILEKIVQERTAEVNEKNFILEQQKAEIESQAEYLEEQKKELNLLNASKDKMFAIIGHDLRSPLGNFHTILDMMVNGPEDFDEEERKELLEMLAHNAQATFELLENLLNWSSSQRGVITYEPSVINAKSVLDHTLRFVSPMAIKKQIAVTPEVDGDILLYADENMFRAILRNLIVNAIKFTRAGGEIKVIGINNGQEVTFGVKDNGIGIAPDVKESLFNQLEHTIRLGTNEEKGSGLGLLLCREFVERHGGRIWVESELGAGSTFFFTLPLAGNSNYDI